MKNPGDIRCNLITMIVVACLAFPARGVGQERIDPMAATVGQWFAMIERDFVGLADAMPAERYEFKPANGDAQLGQLREVVDEILGDTGTEVFGVGIAPHVDERHHRQRIDGLRAYREIG